MNAPSINPDLLKENQYQWREVADYLTAQQIQAADLEKIERLAVASNYALDQMRRTPESINSLLGLQEFILDAEVINLNADEKIDLDKVKQQLRRYRHRKLVEIIYLDVVASNPLEKTLHHLSDLADLLIRSALKACQQHLSVKHGQPLESNGDAMELNVIAMGKLGGRELNFSSDIDLICCYDSEGELSGYGQQRISQRFIAQTKVVLLILQ